MLLVQIKFPWTQTIRLLLHPISDEPDIRALSHNQHMFDNGFHSWLKQLPCKSEKRPSASVLPLNNCPGVMEDIKVATCHNCMKKMCCSET